MNFIVCKVNIGKADFPNTHKINFKGLVKLMNLCKQNQGKDYKEAISRRTQLQAKQRLKGKENELNDKRKSLRKTF